jgi:phenylpyruvate tautomerase PptA (4-oxalocrotonate tautomerase family)
MPLARIDLIEGKSPEYRRTIADVVYDKMIECLGVPEDRFQTITEHKAENFLFDPDYLSLYRSENCIFIQLIFLDVASPEQKAAFYKAVVDQLHEKLQVRPEDVFFNLMTVQPADWPMGNGQATTSTGCRLTVSIPIRSRADRGGAAAAHRPTVPAVPYFTCPNRAP